MRDVFNPMILLLVLLLLATRVTSGDGEMTAMLDMLMLTVCTVCMVVCLVLGVARMLVHRRALMPIVWALVYLIVGCSVWSISFQQPEEGEDTVALRQLQAAYAAGGNPWAQNEEGDTLPELAAAMGKGTLLADLLQVQEPAMPQELKEAAAHAAAAAGKVATLALMLDAGVAVDARYEGATLLNAAAQNGMTDAMQMLLARGADANAADAEGMTPLMNAAMVDRPAPVRLLLEYGANAALRDASGRDAASYARSEAVADLLAAPAEGQP